MGPALRDYVLIGAVAAVVTAIATPIVRAIAVRVGWVVPPNERSVHTSPMPQVGGMAMFAGLVVALLVAWRMSSFTGGVGFDSGLRSELIGVGLAAAVVFLIGFADDIFGLAPPAKVTGVVLAGVVLVYFGVTMFYFRVPFYGVILMSSDWTPLVTVIWLLGMTQAINLIDGLDGLAGGIVLIASLAFFVYSFRLSSVGLLPPGNIGPLIAIITAGVCAGFLPYNFNPARIFMGDSGAFLLGLLLAVSTSVVGGRANPSTQAYFGQTFFFFAPLVIPLLVLGVPILDTIFAIIRRASRRQALDVADKGHLHHRLMNLGHGHRRSVLILWGWTALLSAFVLYPVVTNQNPSYVSFGVGAAAIALYTVLHPSVRRKRAMEIEEALNRPASEQIDPSRPERREHLPAQDLNHTTESTGESAGASAGDSAGASAQDSAGDSDDAAVQARTTAVSSNGDDAHNGGDADPALVVGSSRDRHASKLLDQTPAD